MPLFIFKCDQCQAEERRLVSVRGADESLSCSCGGLLSKQLPKNISSEIHEARDRVRGIQVKKDLDKKLRKRMTEHHDKHLVQEKIDQYGIDDALKFGWDKIATGKKR